MQERISAFGSERNQYAEEAEARWGQTPQWQQAQAKQGADYSAVKAEMEAFAMALADAKSAGVAPGSQAALELVERHRAQIEQWYDCSREMQVCLARMYVADERFYAAYGGNQDYLLELIEAQAAKEGIVLAEVKWQ